MKKNAVEEFFTDMCMEKLKEQCVKDPDWIKWAGYKIFKNELKGDVSTDDKTYASLIYKLFPNEVETFIKELIDSFVEKYEKLTLEEQKQKENQVL